MTAGGDPSRWSPTNFILCAADSLWHFGGHCRLEAAGSSADSCVCGLIPLFLLECLSFGVQRSFGALATRNFIAEMGKYVDFEFFWEI